MLASCRDAVTVRKVPIIPILEKELSDTEGEVVNSWWEQVSLTQVLPLMSVRQLV